MKPMLAKDGDLTKISYPLIVQPKLDGIRACVVDGQLVSRTLKPIQNAEIQAALGRPELNGLDGELIVGPATAADCYRRTASFVMARDKTGESWTYHVFDKWDESGGFEDRMLAATRVCALELHENIRPVDYLTVEDEAALEAYEELMLAAGHEGVIARPPAGEYKFGRSGKTGPLIKIKRFIDFEAKVIGVYEEQHNANEAKRNALGRTERSSAKSGKIGKGTLGGLVLMALNGPAAGVEFRCGTGFDAALRADLWVEWHEQETFTGRIAKIKSFPIGVKDKPRHPVFLGWRDPDDFLEVESGWSGDAVDTGRPEVLA